MDGLIQGCLNHAKIRASKTKSSVCVMGSVGLLDDSMGKGGEKVLRSGSDLCKRTKSEWWMRDC